MPSVTYKPSSGTGYTFEDKFQPVATKNEWGVDTLTREQWGAQPELVTFINGLAQGDTYTFNGGTWYLQTWSCDNDNVYPTVTMNYMGLNDGIPDPKIIDREIDGQGTISCTSPSEASRTFSYHSSQTTYRYIVATEPTGPTYTACNINIDPSANIFKSTVFNADGTQYLGTVPAPLLTALTPVSYDAIATLVSCESIIGTPWFMCEDQVTNIPPSNA